MNILYIANHLNIGGISSYVLTLATGLKRRGHNIYIASSGGALLSRFTQEGIHYISIPIKTKRELSPKILFSMFKLKNIVKARHIEIIHTHSRTTQVLGCLLSKNTGVTHISTCHGFFKKRILRRIFHCWGKKNIAISEPVKEHLVKDLEVKKEDIRVIHNGIDIMKFIRPTDDARRTAKQRLGLGSGPVVGIVARLSDVKGHRYLIEAMPEVLARFPQAQLLIVGEGREKQGLIKLVRRLNMAEKVFFIPAVPDTQEVLAAMDVFVLPSLKEGLGLALIEAMACGLAVVGSDIGGIKNLIQHGKNGLLAAPADSVSLARGISELLGEAKKRAGLGDNAREFVSRNFSQEEMVIQTERLYLECVN